MTDIRASQISLQTSGPWQQYKRPFVRDLAFALACPDALTHWISPNSNLVSPKIDVHPPDFWYTQYTTYAERLHHLDNTTAYQELTRYLMSRPSPYRLGFHFEGLMHFWLEDGYRLQLHPYEVVAHNVQLYNGMQTTGELDFILHNKDTNEIEHWELAIKFYLGSAPYGFANWVGINNKDTLERKLTHMQTKPFRSLWVDLDFYEKVKIDKRYVVMKGRFFRPNEASFVRPQWLNEHFPLHTWYQVDSKAELDALAMPNLRPAHYIEWITNRPFYESGFLTQGRPLLLDPTLNKAELSRRRHRLAQWPYSLLRLEHIDTNLYFNEQQPVVLVRPQ
ncbi:DUF1853 family protein [Psychrobacter sp. YP14]|uniref:DUF1853 family protein n=1 Tax=Psychrobacter sp. YP14 TaxID=2203895 RepID=UPI001D0D9B2B|nr:DUF1853 family protein [Psychrobacter sp. YP14]